MNRHLVDFRQIKATITIEMVLASYGVRLHRVDQHYLRGRCPLPMHVSKSSTQSLIVNTEKNAWICHSESCAAARNGRQGGNVLDFVAWMENGSIRDAAVRLQEWFSTAPPTLGEPPTACSKDVQPGSTSQCDRNPPLPFALTGVDVCHPYLASRGILPETARQFGIGLFPRQGMMQGRIVIPVHDEDGVLIAYAGRSLDEGGPKYRFPVRFRKSLVLFNLHRAVRHGDRVIVVEGFFDCLKVHQAGLSCVVALMGCSLSARQELVLTEHFREVTLLLDGDRPGRAASVAIAARLVNKVSTRIVEVPAGAQPDQLNEEQIRLLCIPGYF